MFKNTNTMSSKVLHQQTMFPSNIFDQKKFNIFEETCFRGNDFEKNL